MPRKYWVVLGLFILALVSWETWRMMQVVPPPPPPPIPQAPISPPPPPVPVPPPVKKETKVTPPPSAPVKVTLTPRQKPLVPPPPPVVTPPAPQQVSPPPPPPTTEEQEWSGNDTSVTHVGQVVIHSDHQWISFWAEHHPHEVSPDVDFTQNMVIGVFAGPRPAEAFAIRIIDVRPSGEGVIVDYQEKLPPPGTFAEDVTVYPYDIKVVPIIKGKIKFNALAIVDPNRIIKK